MSSNSNENLVPQIHYEIDTDMVQSIVEANLGREMTDQELKRLQTAFTDSERAYDAIMEAVLEAAKDAMENEDGRWNSFDADYV